MTGQIILAVICFFWAAIALVSRLAMLIMRDKWKKWELDNAYTEKRPGWITPVIVLGLLLIGLTWFSWLYYAVPYGWVIAVLASLTLVKLGTFVFNYNKFREFVAHMLNTPKKMAALNAAVLVLATGLITLGFLVYLP